MGSQRFPRADDNWEDLNLRNKKWVKWQKIYFKATSKKLLRG